MTTWQPAKKTVILDRDGTIVIDREYLSDPEQLAFLPGAAEGLRFLYERGYRLVVITNQSGVDRGLFSLTRLKEIHERLSAMVSDAGAQLEAIYFCPHTPDAGCICRKPATGLLASAAADLHFEMSSVVVIGDKNSDTELGKRVGAPTILVTGKQLKEAITTTPDYIVHSLLEAAELIEEKNSPVQSP